MQNIYEAGDVTEAQLIKGMLEAHGVRVHSFGEYLTGAMGELPAIGLIRLQVDEQDVPRARQILEDYRTGRLSLPDVPGEQPDADDDTGVIDGSDLEIEA